MKKISLVLLLTLVLSFGVILSACGAKNTTEAPKTEESKTEESKTEESKTEESKPEESKPEESKTEESKTEEETKMEIKENPIAKITMENGDEIVIELFPQYAPESVNNFVTLANSGYYDGLTFHRLVPGFVIQGGDPDGTGMGGPGYSIKGEFIENGFKQNTLSHTRGVISMARSMSPDSAGSQFFIVTDDMAIPSLDGKYAGFGIVREGMEIVDQIVSQPTNNEAPVEKIVMKSITVNTKGTDYPAPTKLAE